LSFGDKPKALQQGTRLVLGSGLVEN